MSISLQLGQNSIRPILYFLPPGLCHD